MADTSQFKKMADQAVQLNLSYYRSLFSVTKDYLEAVQTLVVAGFSTTSNSTTTSEPAEKESPVTPILLAGTTGKKTESAFTIVNHLNHVVNADVQLSDSLRAAGVLTIPEGKQLAPGETAVFHVVAKINEAMDFDKDIHGTLSVPKLASREIPVLVRRLASPKTKSATPTPGKAAKKKKKSPNTKKRVKS